MKPTHRPSIYDQLRPHLDAADLISRLGLVESRRIGSEAYCKPLCHDSASGESLQVNLHTGRWNCKACQHAGVRGDLIQLVEYVLSGGRAPSHGEAQGASATHREAVVWLCQQFGIPFDEERVSGDGGLDIVHLFAMLAHEHLLKSDRVLDWILEKWGFDRATVEAYGIGFMPSPILPALHQEARAPGSRTAFKSSGLGWFGPDGTWRTHFEGRVTFPYLEHGRAVYLIGRATPWTPPLESGSPPPKYHKLSVHSETRPYISERVTNDHLYNEPVMSSADEIGVLEGVADAVAISSLGVPVVSPVTISFNAVDQERFLRKCREKGIRRVWILFDNELSGSGNWAARRVGTKLVQGGLQVRVLTLPLGPEQQRARDEVISMLGPELFDEFERSDPNERKKLVERCIPEEARRSWFKQQVDASKIDAAEWTAKCGAGAAGKFDAIRRAGKDVIDLLVEEIAARGVNADDDPTVRASLFNEAIDLAAHIEDAIARGGYAGTIARAAGKGVSKADVLKRIAQVRKLQVKPKREDEREADRTEQTAAAIDLIVLPPEAPHTTPAAPKPPTKPGVPGAPPAPPPPGQKLETPHQRYASARDAVNRGVEAKLPIEHLGEYVAQIVTVSMGYTPFRTADELFLVRGNEKIGVGLDHPSARFESLLFLASGLTPKKSSHRAYIAAVVYFLETVARRAEDVSWSHVSADRCVFFPTGDESGRILKIEPGKVTRTRMAECRVPTVSGNDFVPFNYIDEVGGVEAAMDVFRWTSLSTGDRLVLTYWLVCLPLLRRIGTVPIVRIEGGSSSGKTRTVEAVSYLVNGRKGSSVPTPAALVSRMSTEMLTIDDNRESGDISPAFLGTLLQATHLGAREKRKVHSDTGTVIERVCGALLMNGVEPIHDGRPELASRMLTLRCDASLRITDSPSSEESLREAVIARRDAFWSDAVRRCAIALQLDREHGEHVGAKIEALFGATKIGRLSSYLRIMYLAWVAGLERDDVPEALDHLSSMWRDAFTHVGDGALNSLLSEELSVSSVRYAFAYGKSIAKGDSTGYGGPVMRTAFGGKYVESPEGEVFLGPMRATHLAQIVREAGKVLNAPPQIAQRLRAGQLEQRLMDGLGFLRSAGFDVEVETTQAGRRRFTFRQIEEQEAGSSPPAGASGDTWTAP